MFQQWISHKIAQKQLEPDEFTSSDTLLVTELSWSDIWFYIVDGKNTHTLLVARTKEEDSSIHWAQCMYIRADVQIRKVHLKFPSNHTQISYMCRWLVLCFVLFFIWLLVFFFFFFLLFSLACTFNDENLWNYWFEPNDDYFLQCIDMNLNAILFMLMMYGILS